MHNQVEAYITTVMKKASNMLDHFTIPLEPEDLYSMLCGGNQHMLSAAITLGNYMERESFTDMVTVPVLMAGTARPMEIKFTISLTSCTQYPRYFMPMRAATVTPESKLFDQLMPGIVLAQEWRITQDLFNHFKSVLSIEQLCDVLPWVKELARDGLAELEASADAYKFTSKYGLNWLSNESKKQKLKVAFRRVAHPGKPARMPALTRRISEATRLGDRLFTQYRMLKSKDASVRGTFVAVALTDNLLPQWYLDDIAGVLGHWEEEETERKLNSPPRK